MMTIIGHHLVKALCNRFNAIKAVKNNQLGDTKCANASDNKRKLPAIRRKPSLLVMSMVSK